MPGQAGSRMDQRFCADISSIASSLNRIANFMEAAEIRARKEEEANAVADAAELG